MPEAGAATVRAAGDLVVSALARVEVAGALLRKRRLERVGERETAIAMEGFAADWRGSRERARRFAVVGVSDALIERAVELAAAGPLRAYDAVQLASLEAAIDAGVEIEGFACFDLGLRDAAAERGHALLPASLPLSP